MHAPLLFVRAMRPIRRGQDSPETFCAKKIQKLCTLRLPFIFRSSCCCCIPLLFLHCLSIIAYHTFVCGLHSTPLSIHPHRIPRV